MCLDLATDWPRRQPRHDPAIRIARVSSTTAKSWRLWAVLLFFFRVLAAFAVVVPLLFAASLASVALAFSAMFLIAGSFVRWVFLLLIAETEFIAPPPGVRVAVVTTFVPEVESLQMLERTLRAMTQISYPHDTWLLDEGDDAAAIELCQRLGVRHFSRRADCLSTKPNKANSSAG